MIPEYVKKVILLLKESIESQPFDFSFSLIYRMGGGYWLRESEGRFGFFMEDRKIYSKVDTDGFFVWNGNLETLIKEEVKFVDKDNLRLDGVSGIEVLVQAATILHNKKRGIALGNEILDLENHLKLKDKDLLYIYPVHQFENIYRDKWSGGILVNIDKIPVLFIPCVEERLILYTYPILLS